ncbi:hypothetical protein [Deefgea sp. CFH1-16]|uniref:hypothetical protein n=1 Tax=Deefgea sp. CFH1-16 TaxID=2675457 RepID=UPI0015F683A6|nr:hypothetical protein [Deefgea sp. CFH1-16]MBM5575329.1 hypothetical protein [Deefgea sp. CFH1-16]
MSGAIRCTHWHPTDFLIYRDESTRQIDVGGFFYAGMALAAGAGLQAVKSPPISHDGGLGWA